MPEIVQVEFKKRWRVYNEGELAGFPEEIVRDLEEAGIAVRTSGEPAEPKVPAPATPEASKPAEGAPKETKTVSLAEVVKKG
jgi:hypothetical protein